MKKLKNINVNVVANLLCKDDQHNSAGVFIGMCDQIRKQQTRQKREKMSKAKRLEIRKRMTAILKR